MEHKETEKKPSITELLQAHRRERESLHWEGKFREYFEMVVQNPKLSQLAHARICEMILSAGVTKLNEGTRDEVTRYNFFSEELFGIDEAIEQLVEYFKSAAQRLEVRKRILLLMGPVGGGKSTIVTLLKRGLEKWTHTEPGAVYAIKGCPMHGDPLHLIPADLRKVIDKHYGIYIEGELSPQARYDLEHTYGGKHEDVLIERIVYSEKDRIGIGTFAPSDPKCVVGNTILLTDQGMFRFDELQSRLQAEEDQFVPFNLTVSGRAGRETTSHFYNGGIKPTRKIKTRLGFELEGSLVHPVLVLKDGEARWTKLADLNVGDCVALQHGQQMFGSMTALPAFEYAGPSSRGQNKNLTLPTELTSDLARLLGYIVAEGSLTDTGLWITNATPRVLDDIRDICRQLFSVEPKTCTKAGTPAVSLSISSVKLVQWLETVCGITRGAASKRTPQIISSAPKELMLAFFEGLFWGDGTISARGRLGSNRFKLATASRELATQLQVALLNMGIVAAVHEERIKGKFTAYSVIVTGDAVVDLIELIPSLRDKCTDDPSRLALKRGRTNFNVIPEMHSAVHALMQEARRQGQSLSTFRRYATTAAWGRNLTPQSLARLIEESEWLLGDASPALELLRERRDENLLWLEVQSITEGHAHVYDLTVPGTHSFCANGFINHNSQDISELTGSIDLSSIGEVGVESDPRAYRFDGELNIANRGIMEFIEILKCIRGNSLIRTGLGVIQFDELWGNMWGEKPPHPQDVRYQIGVQTRNGIEETTHLIYRGEGESLKIRTRKGYVLEGAPDHRILVLSIRGQFEWRALKDLEPKDRVCIDRKGYWTTTYPELAPFKSKSIGTLAEVLPDKIDTRLARLIGYFVAEGCYLKQNDQKDRGILITNQNPQVIADLKEICTAYGLKMSSDAKGHHALSHAGLATLFHQFGFDGRRAHEKHIPQIIRRSPKEIMSAFLRAYFDGDGTVTTYISCSTASERLAEQLQIVLLNYGIISKCQRHFNEKTQRTYYMIQIDSENIAIFNREIGFGIDYKRELAEKLEAEDHIAHRDTVPNLQTHWSQVQQELQVAAKAAVAAAGLGYRDRFGARQLIGDMNYEQLWRFAKGKSAPSYQIAKTIAEVASEHVTVPEPIFSALESQYFFDEVEEKTEGRCDLWDFHVPEEHSYVGNGFVNHNCDEKFLYSLLTLSQEQSIKTGRYAMIYADEVIVSHTNENEYQSFVGNKKNEALQDRIIMIRVPYNLKVSEEERIYKKLLQQSELRQVHIAPYTLHVAAIFAVLTRLEPPKRANVDILKKMKLYDGEDVEGFKSKDVRELKAETVREGMFGISPRYIINRLSNALIKEGHKYITAIDALRAIRDGFDQHTGINAEERERYLNLITMARKEYDEIAKLEVQRAFVYSFEEMAKSICDNYLDNVEAYCNKEKIKDALTEEELEPDEKLMRSIEEQIGISENAKNTFRQEILIRISTYARKGKRFEYNSHERLKEAIEKKIFSDLKDVVKITTSAKSPDPDQLRRINEVIDRLVREHGYTTESANDLLNYVGTLLSR
ncbi:MAG TPA: LAGLIDADG family homing endonuclease [Acidobacteriota bacterium]|nr:LAGLIDADG family homing endonuclease [Acidobacteriota bacterium]